MTRGVIILILDDRILVSVEFNGDMYYDCYGKKVMNKLASVETEDDFREFVEKFDSKYFKYKEYDGVELIEKVYDKSEMSKILDMRNTFNAKFRNSDYEYFLNLSGRTISVIDSKGKILELPNKGVGVLCYREYENEVQKLEKNMFSVKATI